MYHNVANCRRKALLIFLCFFSLFIKANATDNGDWWLQRQITLQQNSEDYARRVYGSARHAYDTPITKDGITKMQTLVKNVVVEDTPSKSKLGNVLLKRGKAFKGGVAGVVGGAAIVGMIEAVGWVMEEGTWVKYKQPEEDENCTTCDLAWESNKPTGVYKYYATYKEACPRYQNGNVWGEPSFYSVKSQNGYTINSLTSVTCHYYSELYPDLRNWDIDYPTYKVPNPVYDPNKPNTPQRIVITPDDVGGIATGDYVDPVDDSQNIDDKKYKPVVVTAYEHDPSGVGEDIANETDDRIKNAPPTSDGQPSPIGDPKYSTPPEEDEETNDRSWEDDKVTDAVGDSTPKNDPETGEPTGGQKISITFPVFCTWAFSVCDWYDQWRVSDTVYKDYVQKTKEHQSKEVTFWSRVTDFFDWTKDESNTDEEPPEIINEIPLPELNTGTFQASAGCPPPIAVPIDFGTQGEIQISYEPICQMAEKWSFVAPLIGFLSGAMILIGVGRKGEDGEI